ncbi:MAG: 1-deoxy-D-xylulose-5-phosphate reductoisomerase, partial [Bdellovibrionales bacterium]|nr:1-deoxy-D-xylulose-5-phosphate reductoisomerase [Bdellovibrionales bacterium]
MRCAVAVLGSTGSIGTQTLDVIRENQDTFYAAALTGNSNVELMLSQVREFKPKLAVMVDEAAAEKLEALVGGECRVAGGEAGLLEAAALDEVNTVMAAVVGFAGLRSILHAISKGKHIALANKESLVAGGSVVMAALENSSSMLVPVDSEHNSIFQCLLGRRSGDELRRIVLTASGGPFLHRERESLAEVTPDEALKHPRWNMGAKNSLDSATMMNKALEIVEASHLFNLGPERIGVLIHPQSLVHGLIEFNDGSCLAAVSCTDMRIPIGHALSYLVSENPKEHPGKRRRTGASFLDLASQGPLEFYEASSSRFPAIELAYQALRRGPGAAIVMNAANEEAGAAFLQG